MKFVVKPVTRLESLKAGSAEKEYGLKGCLVYEGLCEEAKSIPRNGENSSQLESGRGMTFQNSLLLLRLLLESQTFETDSPE